MKIESYSLKVNNLKMYYRTVGSKKNPTLLFLHGWGTTLGEGFFGNDKLIRWFAKKFFVIAPELPGFIRSDTPKKVWGYKEYAQAVHNLVRKLNIKEFFLVGYSFGGAVATVLAKLFPFKVKKLFLINPITSERPKTTNT